MMRVRLLAAVLGLTLGLATLPTLADADSAPGSRFCTVRPTHGNPVDGCVPLLPAKPAAKPMAATTPPPGDFGIAFGIPVDTPSTTVDALDGNMRQGIALLGAASVATDPNQAAQDRAGAQQAFTNAAMAINGIPLGQATVGFVDPVSGTFVVSPDQWRVDVGDDLTNGLTLLRQNQQQQAMADFQAADTELIQHM